MSNGGSVGFGRSCAGCGGLSRRRDGFADFLGIHDGLRNSLGRPDGSVDFAERLDAPAFYASHGGCRLDGVSPRRWKVPST